jgi:hypothetical protein
MTLTKPKTPHCASPELGRGRDVIYHGTRQLPSVLKTGKLVPPPSGECAIFFSRSAEVAALLRQLPGTRQRDVITGHTRAGQTFAIPSLQNRTEPLRRAKPA